jgi:hypothetical protein
MSASVWSASGVIISEWIVSFAKTVQAPGYGSSEVVDTLVAANIVDVASPIFLAGDFGDIEPPECDAVNVECPSALRIVKFVVGLPQDGIERDAGER